MKELFEPFLDQEIGMNVERSFSIEPVRITGLAPSYLSVLREKDGNTYHIPYLNISRVVANDAGVKVSHLFRHTKTFKLVIKIGHIVEYITA